ncbi:MAG: YqaJ viral recombinase family protein [Balneola sp.]|nr:YqaJ viral recombinase family protein [Balneola sp.]MBO6651439.1 YqaJ viral recombinase family protein [Balneola sp.]MBO6712524.1 YqaJ viral recombinase family protein [Balneola sp.]MBO6800983.1 YqaJ viral recombinase family protein [Balneola sp.]MBO6870655.1 YqaJ viral recombinase family protein [Balneola sp.]
MNLTELKPPADFSKQRREYIGGSDCAAILGESQFSTPLQVFLRKKGILPPIEENPIMDFGHYFEPQLAAHFEQETGLKTRRVNQPITDPDFNFLKANIDRQVLAGKGLDSTAVLELKTTTSQRMKSLDGKLPREWYLQVIWYLGISRYSKAFIQVYLRDTCEFLEPQIIDPNPELFEEMKHKLVHWWRTYMEGEGRRPEPVNGEDALLLYPDSNPEQVVEITPAGYALYQELSQVRERKADLIKMEEHLKTKLKEKLGKAERLVCAGKTLVSWTSHSSTRIDSKAIRRDHPEFYKQYSKTTKTRRFLCH